MSLTVEAMAKGWSTKSTRIAGLLFVAKKWHARRKEATGETYILMTCELPRGVTIAS